MLIKDFKPPYIASLLVENQMKVHAKHGDNPHQARFKNHK
jgi:hypothetical protein